MHFGRSKIKVAVVFLDGKCVQVKGRENQFNATLKQGNGKMKVNVHGDRHLSLKQSKRKGGILVLRLQWSSSCRKQGQQQP